MAHGVIAAFTDPSGGTYVRIAGRPMDFIGCGDQGAPRDTSKSATVWMQHARLIGVASKAMGVSSLSPSREVLVVAEAIGDRD